MKSPSDGGWDVEEEEERCWVKRVKCWGGGQSEVTWAAVESLESSMGGSEEIRAGARTECSVKSTTMGGETEPSSDLPFFRDGNCRNSFERYVSLELY